MTAAGNDKSGAVEIRITAKAQNAILARLADECGSIKAAAWELGVTSTTFSNWMNFKTVLRPGGSGRGGMSCKRFKRAAIALEKKTGRNVRDIFPLSREEMAVINRPRIVEKTIKRVQLTSAVERKYLSYSPDVEEVAAINDSIPEHLLERLTSREREIIKLRFGLGDGHAYAVLEIAPMFKVTKERIWQIEANALRKLTRWMEEEGTADSIDLIPGGDCQWCRRKFSNVFAAILHAKTCEQKPWGVK
uniref:Putative sigma-70 region domain containing protein n=1 Tax=viral metagenome TaxID=1070528 RepID=A0A6M3XIL0_9ZZZZ